MNQAACPNDNDSDARPQQEQRAARRVRAPTNSERRRWHVIALLADETPMAEIVAATGYQPRTIRRIAQRYGESGAAGLADGRQRSVGAAPLLSAEQQRELGEALRHPPPDGGGWNGAKVARWMMAKLGRRVRRQRGWEYLQRLEAAMREDSSEPRA